MYKNEIKPLAESLRVAKIIARDEIFQIPLGIAVALLFAEMLILKRTRRKSIGSSSGLPSTPASPAVSRTAVRATGDRGEYVIALEQVGRLQVQGTTRLAPSFLVVQEIER